MMLPKTRLHPSLKLLILVPFASAGLVTFCINSATAIGAEKKIISTSKSAHESSGTTSTANLKKNVSLEELVSGAISGSVTAQKIKTALANARIIDLQSKAPFEIQTFSTLSYSNSAKDSLSPNAADTTQTSAATLGASKYFDTGTTVTGSFTLNQTDLSFSPPVPGREVGGSMLSFSVEQNLLKDGFGKSSRLKSKGATHSAKAVGYNVADRLEEYAVSISDLFFNTKKSQLGYRAAKESEKEQRKLLKIAKLLRQRGVTEKSDLLEVETSYIKATETSKDALTRLENTWNTSILLLGLDKIYKSVPPMEIILEFEDRTPWAKSVCKEPSKAGVKKAAKFKAMSENLESANASFEASKEDASPELSLSFTHENENFDEELSQATADSLTNEGQANTVALNFSMPIGGSALKAAVFDAARDKKSFELEVNNFVADSITEIENECNTLERTERKIRTLAGVLDKQSERARLDMDRFTVGRLDAFKAIQSSIAVSSARFELEAAKMDLAATIWRLLKLTGEMTEIFSAQTQGAP